MSRAALIRLPILGISGSWWQSGFHQRGLNGPPGMIRYGRNGCTPHTYHPVKVDASVMMIGIPLMSTTETYHSCEELPRLEGTWLMAPKIILTFFGYVETDPYCGLKRAVCFTSWTQCPQQSKHKALLPKCKQLGRPSSLFSTMSHLASWHKSLVHSISFNIQTGASILKYIPRSSFWAHTQVPFVGCYECCDRQSVQSISGRSCNLIVRMPRQADLSCSISKHEKSDGQTSSNTLPADHTRCGAVEVPTPLSGSLEVYGASREEFWPN